MRVGRQSLRRPAAAWAMSLLLLGGAGRCLLGTGTRADTGLESALVVSAGTGCLVLAAAVYVFGNRLPRRVILLLLGFVIVVVSLLVAASSNRADVALSALAYPWSALYAAHILSRRSAYLIATLASTGFAVAIVVSGVPNLLGAWLLVTLTLLAVTAVTTQLVGALRRQSETDPLTGVANRAGFQRLADHTLAAAVRRGRSVALVVCDVDGLKQVNDQGGHAAGDALLTGLVSGWQSVLRGGDVLARLGGDEFVVLMPETDAADAATVIARLRDATDVPFSAGVATWAEGATVEGLLADADRAMYAYKWRDVGVPAQRARNSLGVKPAPTLAD